MKALFSLHGWWRTS
ncbi:trp operon leader peptide [Lelliottia sp.]